MSRQLYINKSDQILWNLLRKSDKVAFEYIYKRHINTLFNFGLKLTQDREIIKDTLQELFTEFWNKRNTLNEVAYIKIYLIKAFRYKLLRAISQANKTKLYTLEDVLADISDDKTTDEALANERKNILRQRLTQLPERQREIIHLRYFQNLNHEEIADILNINYQSVSNLLHRALTKLKKEVQKTPVKKTDSI